MAADDDSVRPNGATPDHDDPTRASFDRLEQLLEFPTSFPLKVMGKRVDGFEQAVADVVARHVPSFDPAAIESRTSSQGSYLSLTMTLKIDSRQQLEALHRELTEHPLVKIVL